LVETLTESGFDTLIVSAADVDGTRPGGWPNMPRNASLHRRPNSGYDFGTWSAVLGGFPQISQAREVILANDSMAGPFTPMTGLVDRMLRIPANVWALTDSHQFGWHPQSYFVGYRNGVLAEPPLQDFWNSVRVHGSKSEVIRRYELGLGRLLIREGYSTAIAFPSETVVTQRGDNPTIKAWRNLMDAGCPLVKRQLLSEPEVATDSGDVPAEVLTRFGVDVKEWL
jgi:lipopolysaccharide biosynthesis protein